MFKKFFRKVRDVVKKAAPIAGIAALGLGGMSMLGGGASSGGIGNLLSNILGNYGTPAASGSKAAVGGSGIRGLIQGGGNILGKIGGSLINKDGTGTAMGGIASTLIPAIGSYFAYKNDQPKPVDTNPMSPVDEKYGSQYGTGGNTDVLVKKTMFNNADGKYYDAVNSDGVYYNYGNEPEKQPSSNPALENNSIANQLAQGGIIALTKKLAAGGETYPRKQGMINGPGGPKEDLIPAKLSNGEFVFTAKAVKNAGGPKAMYNMMNKLDPESSKGTRA
jgi:hypothetical protein